MEALLIYILKTIGLSAIMYGYYWLFLKDKTFHHYNRFYLLSTLILSLVLPIVKIDYFTIEVNPNLYLLLDTIQQTPKTNTTTNDYTFYPLAYTALGLVTLFLLVRFLFGIFKIQKIKKLYPKETINSIQFYSTDLDNAPFSFFRNIFWKNSILINSDLGKQILKHEMVHVQQKHSWDKIFIELTSAVFWFNPIFYLIKKEITIIHEYLADKKTLKPSDTKAFAEMILASQFTGKILPGTSPFLNSNLKKRLKMLKTPKTKFAYARRILALPLLFVIAFALLINAKNREIEEINSAIETAISTIKLDTLKPTEKAAVDNTETKITDTINPTKSDTFKIKSLNLEAVGTFSENPKNDPALRQEIEKSNDNDLFYINGEKTTKQGFSKFYDEHYAKKDCSFIYSSKNIGGYNIRYFGASDDNLNSNDLTFNQYMKQTSELKKQEALNNKELAESAKKMAIFNLQNSEFKTKQGEFEAQIKLAEAQKSLDYINSKEFKNQLKKAEKEAKKATEFVNSKEFKQQMIEVQKKAEEASKTALEIKIHDTDKLRFYALDNKDKKYILGYKKDENGNTEKPRVFIDGKEYTGDLNNIPADEIESIYVNKNNDAGTIRINTKKKNIPEIK